MITAVALSVIMTACSKDPKSGDPVTFGEYIAPQDSFSRVRYFDTRQVSINDRCAVRNVRLSTKMRPVYVNGEPVGFC